MLTAHALRDRPSRQNTTSVVGLYERLLRANWTPAERMLARMTGFAGHGGWSASERIMLSPDIRAEGLSMSARRGVHRLLNPAAVPLATSLLKNKRRFAEWAEKEALPTPARWIAECEPLDQWLEAQSAILLKPSFSSKGRGIVRIERSSDGDWAGARTDGTSRLPDSAHNIVARDGVVQTCVAAHAAIADLSPGALPTLRVVTCRNERSAHEAVSLTMRFSANGTNPVDNFNAGNLVSAVDSTGRCGPAFSMRGAALTEYRMHPESGAMLEGRMMPDFDAAVALAINAHDRMPPGFTVIGWDIGLSTEGPVLIEGNWNPGTDIVQLTARAGIDRLRLGALYRWHLARLTDECWRAVRPFEWDRH